MHEPELIIVDEPFSGLDPVNTQIIKSLLNGMCERGSAIIMSTHQMNRVEEMCQRILLIDHGQRVLYGPIDEIRDRYAAHAVEVALEGELPELVGVERIERVNGDYRLLLQRGVRPEQVLKKLANTESLRLKRFEELRASLEEIFVQVVGNDALTTVESA
jgi:ABC-2 type transport system ATP-binding protein